MGDFSVLQPSSWVLGRSGVLFAPQSCPGLLCLVGYLSAINTFQFSLLAVLSYPRLGGTVSRVGRSFCLSSSSPVPPHSLVAECLEPPGLISLTSPVHFLSPHLPPTPSKTDALHLRKTLSFVGYLTAFQPCPPAFGIFAQRLVETWGTEWLSGAYLFHGILRILMYLVSLHVAVKMYWNLGRFLLTLICGRIIPS